MRIVFACLSLLAATSTFAQNILIRGATVHTVSDTGTLANADVLISDGVVAEVGSNIDAPGGTTVVEAKGRALTPGLFGGLSGIGIEEVALEPTAADVALMLQAPAFDMQWRPEFDVTKAFNPLSLLLPVARIEGLTWTMLAPRAAEGGALLAGQGAAVTLEGDFDAVIEGTHALFVTLGGNMNELSGGSRAAQWMLLEQAVHEARSRGPMQDDALLHPLGRAALAKYLSGGRVVFHAMRASDIRRAIAFAKQNGMKPIIAGAAEAWVVADELAEQDVPVLIDALQNLPSSFDAIGSRLDNAALLHRAGVTLAFTQFGESANARKIRQLAGNAVAHGLPKDVALAAVTHTPAEIFGLGNRGQIIEGQAADLVLWSGDPLEVTSVAEQVWIAGEAVEMRSRQTELRDRYLAE
jgi:imidazolonepropionase-like amidohydrolase